MQNYPLDYDGVVAGAPGPYMPLQSVRMMWFSLLQQREPAGALTDADWTLYESSVTRACDALDGVADGIIENPMRCRFDVAAARVQAGAGGGLPDARQSSRCSTGSSRRCPTSGDGRWIAGCCPACAPGPGRPRRCCGRCGPTGSTTIPTGTRTASERTGDLAAANRAMPELRADRVDIAPFLAAGGKAIIYQGWADPSTNADPTIDYYTRLAAANGGAEALANSVRLFMVPGMYHCGGGPGADTFGGSGHQNAPGDPQRDILWALISWVEDRRAPDRIVATKLDGDVPPLHPRLVPVPASGALRWKGADGQRRLVHLRGGSGAGRDLHPRSTSGRRIHQ